MKPFVRLLSAALLLLSCGCSSVVNSHRQKEPLAEAYLKGDTGEALKCVQAKLKSPEWYNSSVVNTGDELVWRLEAGMLNLDAGRFRESLDEFKKSEALIAEYDDRAKVSVRDVSAEAGVVVTNLNTLPYRGFGRDRIMLALCKSLAYLGSGNEEAFRAQLRRLRSEQKKIEEDYHSFFEEEKKQAADEARRHPDEARRASDNTAEAQHASDARNKAFQEGEKQLAECAGRGYGILRNPAALYLSALGSLRDENYGNALIDLRHWQEAVPSSELARRYYVTALHKAGKPLPPELKTVKPFEFPVEENCLYVLFANGRGAALRQIAVYFPLMVAWPMTEFYPAPFQKLQVSAGRQNYTTALLADMDAVFAQEFQERLPGIITRIVFCTLVKEGAYYGTMIGIGASRMDSATKAALLCGIGIAGIFYRAALNTADTRTWETLPKEFQLTQLPLPEERKVTLTLSGPEGSFTREVVIPPECRSAILYVNAPSRQHVTVQLLPMKTK